MGFSKFVLALSSFCALAVAAPDPVPGFEDPAVLARVMRGEIHVEEKAASQTEHRAIFRAFFAKTEPETYAQLATNHAKYPSMIPDIKEARTVSTNLTHSGGEYDYWMKVVYKVGIFSQTFYPQGRQVYTRPVDAISEGTIVHWLTNYQEHFKSTRQTTRLIPYEGGILIHDDLHIVLAKANNQSALIKKKLQEQFLGYLKAFRKELKAHPLYSY